MKKKKKYYQIIKSNLHLVWNEKKNRVTKKKMKDQSRADTGHIKWKIRIENALKSNIAAKQAT